MPSKAVIKNKNKFRRLFLNLPVIKIHFLVLMICFLI